MLDLSNRLRRIVTFTKSHETHSRSALKAISWRAVGSLDTFVVALFITGSGTLAGGVAATELLTKIALFYFHERVWATITWGRP